MSNTMIRITKACPYCNKVSTKLIASASYVRWQSGALIQDVLPDASDDEREFLISGSCSDCWDDALMNEE